MIQPIRNSLRSSQIPIYAHNIFSLAMCICLVVAHVNNNSLTESWGNTADKSIQGLNDVKDYLKDMAQPVEKLKEVTAGKATVCCFLVCIHGLILTHRRFRI